MTQPDLRSAIAEHSWLHFYQMQRLIDRPPMVITRGAGAKVYDQDGKEYIDALAGLFCVNAGYGREPIARVRECVFPDLTLAAEALHGFIRVLEQEGVPNDRLPLIGRLGRARVSVDVRDARGPRLERRDAKDVEQAIHERFA